MNAIVIGFIVLALYGWYMHAQGKKSGFARGAVTGGVTIAAILVNKNKMSRREALKLMPFVKEEDFDKAMEVVKDANIQPKE